LSTTPPEQQPPPPQGSGYGGYGRMAPNINAIMPVPGNGELVVYILATILIAIIALASDRVDAPAFVTSFTVITLGYLISRGIAKASRVLER
jgi:hypothetical protein